MASRSEPGRTGDMSLNRLFVYGTLRPQCHAFSTIKSVVIRHEPAVLSHFTLVGEGHRYPWCVHSHGKEVVGDLLWLREVEDTLERLDRYEGLEEELPEYRRVVVEVASADRLRSAWAYIGGPGVPSGARPIQGGNWLP